MLKLLDIKKDYEVADTKVHALKGINLCFRKSEFVSILGPSGCGKTTLLNIVGGLDHCTSGDLSIYGKSTSEYGDRDWDVYRNHRIGFIFQSYNLIPHQTVLGNVELALTIAGLGKAERVERAKAALDKVGLNDQYYKKPNQMSGGQCQRVAIARALVNDPEILLADEPTGALDTVTSKQIMELVKEISKERLVIMVTHNPELAEQYSTRIIRLLDGNLVDDTNPFSEPAEAAETTSHLAKLAQQEQQEVDDAAAEAAASGKKAKRVKKERAKMSFFTAFKLSLQNLFTKKRRTAMIAIAGSIGIIGVSLVLSVSIGLQGFINNMQNEMLSGYPIEITQTAFDINSWMGHMSDSEKKEVAEKGNWVNVDDMIAELKVMFDGMDNMMVENDITRDYVEYVNEMPQAYWNAIYEDYGIDIVKSIYTDFSYPTQEAGRETSIAGVRVMYSSVLEQVAGFEKFAPYVNMLDSAFIQAPDTRNAITEEYVKSQYNVLYASEGSTGIAKEYDEVMIVLNSDRAIADLTLGQIGYYTQDEFVNVVHNAIGNDDLFDEEMYDGGKVDYESLIDYELGFKWYDNDSIFTRGSGNTPFSYHPYADEFAVGASAGLPLKVVGILEPKDDLVYGLLESGVYYTTALAEHIVQENWDSELADYLMHSQKTDTLSGYAIVYRAGEELEFESVEDAEKMGLDPSYLTNKDGKYYFVLPADILAYVDGKVITYNYEFFFDGMTTPKKVLGILDGSGSMMMSFIMDMISSMTGSGVTTVSYSLTQMGANVDAVISFDSNDKITDWDVNVDDDGSVFALPTAIMIYPPDFKQKDKALAWLDAWNDENLDITLASGKPLPAGTRDEVVYSDILSMIMNMISSLLTLITIALVGFTSLALVVSCVMIGIITYVSVVERIKEIGVIRSLGGRKRDVSNLFTAETFIIGLASGLIGIIFTYILSFILNMIVGALGVGTIANLPIWVALIMVGVSVGLTLISGLLPSRSAARKDPVVALRTE